MDSDADGDVKVAHCVLPLLHVHKAAHKFRWDAENMPRALHLSGVLREQDRVG